MQQVTHQGIVVAVDGGRALVRFTRQSACSECRARMLCSGGDSESEQREVWAETYGEAYHTGDLVEVTMAEGLARKAVIVAFVVPLFLALGMLFFNVHQMGEMWGAVATLWCLLVYYLVLYLLRGRLGRDVSFSLRHL